MPSSQVRTPWRAFAMTVSARNFTLAMSMPTSPASTTPKSAARLAMCAARALATRVLVGMQPVLTQVPPNSLRSTSATDRPAWVSRFASGGPAWPAPLRAHWRFVADLTRTARVRCVVPIYPLAPRATAKDVVPAVGELVRKLMEDAGSAKVTLIGNSAGAGMALAACLWMRDSGHRQPDGLVLISPGLDFSISRPEQQEIAALDPINDIPGTLELGRLYAGDLGIAHPYVSPLNGDMRGLAPMTVFAGTHDLLYPDSVELAAKAREAGVPVELHLRKGQPHNYAAMPTPEGREARAIIVRAVGQAAMP